LRGATGDGGFVDRVRSNPRLVVAIAAGAVLLLAWIGWAVYVTSSDGAAAGLGVVIAWPAMLAALALISLPFIGGYLLIRRLSGSDEELDVEEDSEASGADAPGDEGDEPEDASSEDEESEEDEGDPEEEEGAESEAAAS
jgi:hypothetical protein